MPFRGASVRSRHVSLFMTTAMFLFATATSSSAVAQSVTGSGNLSPTSVQTPNWNMGSGMELFVGNTGVGALAIEDGGTVSNGFAFIGNQSGSQGTITVSGVGASGNASTWTSASAIFIGSSGTGSLLVDGGGVASSGQGLIGYNTGGVGNVTVSGAGSSWDGANNIYAGFSGTGTLSIEDGGLVSSSATVPGTPTIYIGYDAGSKGIVTVSSSNGVISRLSAPVLSVAANDGATGTLNIEPGGLVSAGVAVYVSGGIGASGTINLDGNAGGRGVLETPVVIDAGGVATLNLNGGILRATQNQSDFLSGFSGLAVGGGGAWIDTNTHNIGISAAFSGSSSFNKMGPGALTLTGDSAGFTGTTTISSGTLQLGDGGTSGSIGGNIVDNGALDFNRSDTVNFAGVVSGSGALDQSGAGTTILTGANTYSGGTMISSGTLQLGNGGSSGSITGNVADNGTFVIDHSSTAPFSGVISGAGGLVVIGGTTTLTADNTYTGGTRIVSGAVLSVGSDNALGGAASSVSLTGNGTLAATSPFSTARSINVGTTGGTLSGPVTVTMDPTTASALTLTGSLNVSGVLTTTGTILDNAASQANGAPSVTVAGGLFEVGDINHPGIVLNAPVTVESGAVLRGHGTIAGDVIDNGGTVAPGGTVGVMKVLGDYAQTPSGTLFIEITPSDQIPGVGYSQLSVSGTVWLGGGLAVQVDPGAYTVGESYDIVHGSGGVLGKFSTVSYDGAFSSYIVPQINYLSNDVYLKLVGTAFGFSTGNGVIKNGYILNQDIAGSLDAALTGRKGYWGQGLGGFGSANGASVADYGAIAGYGVQMRSDLVLGFAVGGTGSSTDTSYEQVNNREVEVYGYGIYRTGSWRLADALGVGHLGFDTSRDLVPTGLGAQGNGHGWFLDTGVRLSYQQKIGHAFLQPFISARYLHIAQSGFSEHGAGLYDLAYGGQRSDLGMFTAGARASRTFQFDGLAVAPWLELAGTSWLGNKRIGTIEALGLDAVPVSARVAPAATLDAGSGVLVRGKGGWSGSLLYLTRFGYGTQINTFDLVANYRW